MNTYLTTSRFEDFLQQDYFERGNGKDGLRLNRWEFFDPYSLVFLLLMARRIHAEQTPAARAAWDFGGANPALAYLSQVGFFEQLRDIDGDVQKAAGTAGPRGASSKDILLKITPIRQREHITDAIKRLMDTTAVILRDHLSYTPQDISLFLGAFTEVAQNILDHSGDWGYAAAQIYKTKQGVPFAALSVGDLGVGIRQTLSARYPHIKANDVIAIRKAFDPAASRFDGRGWGLTQVRSVTEKYNGTLWVRSGAGLVKFHRLFTSHQTRHFPGTQIGIYLEARKPATGSVPSLSMSR